MPRVYLDHNATTPMTESVRRALAGALERLPGNPSSPHREGQASRLALEEAREEVARFAGAAPEEVLFTSGGSEANNLALRGLAAGAGRRRKGGIRVITSAVEHPSVLQTCRDLEREGVALEVLPVDRDGLVDPSELRSALVRRGADVVSIMHANNETGVIQPVEDLAGIARERGSVFHSDMAQSAGKIPIAEAGKHVSSMTLAAHKLGGPPGIGALILKRGSPLAAQITGGAQEGRRRAGTESVALAVAFARALRDLDGDRDGWSRLAGMRDGIERLLPDLDPDAAVHGAGTPRIPNTTSFFLPGAPGRYLVMQLDLAGFAVSTGSACSTGSARPSHVLEAMGCSREESGDSVRVSLGAGTEAAEVEAFCGALRQAVGRAREAGRCFGALSEGAMVS